MDVLVVGGTRFVGRAMVEALLAQGHEVTLFNRGTRPEVFPDVARIAGDRNRVEDLQPVGGRRWDAVLDTCAFRPPQVRSLLHALAGEPHYTLVSTISVYVDPPEEGPDEDAPVHEPMDDGEVTGDAYGPLKVGCERLAADLQGSPLIVRPGVVAGPHDPTDRFTYWPVRVARGGELLAPEGPGVPVQWIDARDLGHWVARMIGNRRTGTYNAVRPPGHDTLGSVLDAASEATGTAPDIVWADETFLLERDVAPFRDLPLWVPEAERALMRTSAARADAAGLSSRPTIETVRDTLDWVRRERGDAPWQAGLDPERERMLIQAWRRREPPHLDPQRDQTG